MEQWRIIDLDYTKPLIAQTFYEAVAEAVHRNQSPNTLILTQPDRPYACLGYHQDIEKELDLPYLQQQGLSVIRRSQGGGATYLDSNQVFYQAVFKDSKAIPGSIDGMFKTLLNVTVQTYRTLGVPAQYKPLNDVVVNNKKISGNGAGQHESTSILVGNIILDLNYPLMARVLKVPDEKFRDKMATSMQQWVTTLKRELGTPPTATRIKNVYKKTFTDKLDVQLTPSQPTENEWNIYETETKPRHTSREWLYMEQPERSRDTRSVKIAHDIKIVEVDHKAGKLLRLRAELEKTTIRSIQIRGDYFIIPKEAITNLEDSLKGTRLDPKEITPIVTDFYNSGIELPGFKLEDIVTGIMKLRDHT